MNAGWKAAICRLLVVLMAWAPFEGTKAGMIETGQALADRQTIVAFLERTDVTRELERLGVDPAAAKGRVLALSDEEAAALAREVESAPAGGTGTFVRLFSAGALILIVVVVVWAIVSVLFKAAPGGKS